MARHDARDSLTVGDFLPDFQLTNQRGGRNRLLSNVLGRAVVVLFLPDAGSPAAERLLGGFAELQERLARHIHLLAINGADAETNAGIEAYAALPFPVLGDPDGAVASSYGVAPDRSAGAPAQGDRFRCFLADPNRRILRLEEGSCDEPLAARLLDHFESTPTVAPLEVGFLAPVLTVPRTFDAAFCQRLIALYETGGNAPSGVFRDDYREAGGLLKADMKVRRDHIVQDPAINNEIGGIIGRRVVPEITKAFSFKVNYVKEFKIVCYDSGDGGFFQPHRDNINPIGSGRRFAMTLNLNTGDYEGGYLRFPEYGPHLYRPGAGDAVVFACHLVHEAMPVTAGRRYVLLTFFYGPEGEDDVQG